jgi:4-amino-4-deoxychorismate lyase
MSNVFIVTAGNLLTPALEDCGVAGVMRAAVLAAAREAGLSVLECPMTTDTLHTAQEIFVTNALIGAWPVMALEQHRWPVGPVTRQIQHWIGSW